ncbi:uncharacterized protein MKK02DRAFT_38409 [Dioszegia hungarica]|uniref:Uncharacterized protein n=1 Tax=Dioszegia hungarica TaxID=4972 RepID=A0AA38H444_9TREE|nr:uncharacterized protein MKK02DRAFT_38409 [Dioszegia hungarica]KAI9633753.1 hypothetical protein MKK02DRAFT_38409 [Dioszegia hungarica]
MPGILSSLWAIGTAYKPNATRDRQAKPLRFGAFAATYRPPGWAVKRPRTDAEAQRLYNHVRTVAYWLDAAPVLADLGLPFKAGLDDVISLVPIYGDIVAGVLQLYQVWLSFVFGVPRNILGLMILNVLIDVFVGIIPILGDFLDNLFKSNLRNLALLEDWLLTGKSATAKYHILLMPDGGDFLPPPKKQHKDKWSKGWFGSTNRGEEEEERDRERARGRPERTRRMRRDEGEEWGATPVAVPAEGMPGEPSRAGPSEPRGSQRAGQVPVQEGLD